MTRYRDFRQIDVVVETWAEVARIVRKLQGVIQVGPQFDVVQDQRCPFVYPTRRGNVPQEIIGIDGYGDDSVAGEDFKQLHVALVVRRSLGAIGQLVFRVGEIRA